MGEVGGVEVRAELSETEEGEANPARSAPILFQYPFDPGIRNNSGNLLIATGQPVLSSSTFCKTQATQKAVVFSVLSGIWPTGLSIFLSTFLKHNNCPALSGSMCWRQRTQEYVISCKVRKGVVTSRSATK